MARVSHKALFDRLRDTNVITRATQYAHWTLPQLMADYTQLREGSANVERDYQEIGAILVNNLSTKLARVLFPTQYPFFKIESSKQLREEARKAGISDQEYNAGTAKLEMMASGRLFLNASYAQLILMLKHLIITGNALVHRDSKAGKCTTYGLQSFVTRRDGKGSVLDCVLRESTYVEALPPDVQAALKSSNRALYSRPEQAVEVFTRIHRGYRGTTVGFEVSQEVDVIPVGEPSWYPEHLCPWIMPTWGIIAGEHYGRGMVEDYAGGFAKLSDMSEAHALYCVEIMRVLHLVSASSGTDIDDFMAAETGEYLRGDPNSVSVHEGGDKGKLEQAAMEIDRIFQRLAKAFMYQSNVRQAERVTMYELQRDAQEAENALGGAYSSLSSGVQVPLAHVTLLEVSDAALAGIVSGEVKVDVTAGIPSLGRSADVQNIIQAAQEIAAVAPIAQIDTRIDVKRVADVIFAGRSVDSSTLFFSEQEQAQIAAAEKQAMQGQQQLLQAASVADQSKQIDGLLSQG